MSKDNYGIKFELFGIGDKRAGFACHAWQELTKDKALELIKWLTEFVVTSSTEDEICDFCKLPNGYPFNHEH